MVHEAADRFKRYSPAGQSLIVGTAGAGAIGYYDFARLLHLQRKATQAGMETGMLAGRLAQEMTYRQMPATMLIGGAYMAMKQGLPTDMVQYLRSGGRDPEAKQRMKQGLLTTAMWEGAVAASFGGTHYGVEKAYKLLRDIPLFQQEVGSRVEGGLMRMFGENAGRTVSNVLKESFSAGAVTFAIAPFVALPVLSLAGKALAFYHQSSATQEPHKRISQDDQDSSDEHGFQQSMIRSGMMQIDDMAIMVARNSQTASAESIANAISARI